MDAEEDDVWVIRDRDDAPGARVYLTMHSGAQRGTVTGLEPEIAVPLGAEHPMPYAKPRDFLLWRHVCREGIKVISGHEPPEPLEPKKYLLVAIPLWT